MNELIFVDFDDTLCLHTHKIDSAWWITVPPELIVHNAYKESARNEALIKWLKWKQEDESAQIYVLSAAASFMMEAKKFWMQENCPEITVNKYISVSIDVSKADVIEAYHRLDTIMNNNCRIYYIDDSDHDRMAAEALNLKNVIIRSPQYITNFS